MLQTEPSSLASAAAIDRATAAPPLTDFLDGCRGLAALYVCFSHACYLLAAGYQDGLLARPSDYSAIDRMVFYVFSLFRFGNEGVMFFFVLSGFVIHLKYAQKVQRDRSAPFEWKQYVWRRARRLYPPLLLAIGLTFLLDRVGMSLGFPIYFGRSDSLVINATVHPDHSWTTLLGNLAFLMDCYVPAWGTNGPLWSLHYEWWFYMLYPLFFWISRRSIALAAGVMGAVALATQWPFPAWANLLPHVLAMMPIWWLGVLLADGYAGRIRVPMAGLAWLAVLLPLGLFDQAPGLRNAYHALHPDAAQGVARYCVALGFVGLIALGIALRAAGYRLVMLNRLKVLGEMSYTLYVIHFPILAFLGGWLMLGRSGAALPVHFGYAVGGVLITILMSYVAHLVVEKPFLPRRVKLPAARH